MAFSPEERAEALDTLADYFDAAPDYLFFAWRHEDFPGDIWKAVLALHWPEKRFTCADKQFYLLCDLFDTATGLSAAELLAQEIEEWDHPFPGFGFFDRAYEIKTLRRLQEYHDECRAIWYPGLAER
jgi:hypothetical protein